MASLWMLHSHLVLRGFAQIGVSPFKYAPAQVLVARRLRGGLSLFVLSASPINPLLTSTWLRASRVTQSHTGACSHGR
jgi:hypothetical protein